MIRLNKKLLLIFIIALAAFLRLWKLNSYPAFNADEAAIGYNVYSLLETGKDEHGNPWPVHFQSFNDYKPGGYFYLVLPFVKLLGLNEWSVRFPAALLGVLAVYIIYLLSLKLFRKENISLIAATLLAISPWHIHFSRGGWEVNAATTFILLGVYLTISFLEEKKWMNRFYAAMFFIASMYTYHSARVITPLILVGIDLIYMKKLEVTKNIKKYGLIILMSLFVLMPLVTDLLKPQSISRAAGVGLFADPGPINRIEEQRTQHSDFRSLPSKFMHNKLVNYGLAFLENWSEHYHGLFLFLSGDDIQRNKVPETGQMYMVELLFVLAGLWAMAKNFGNGEKLVIWWLLIAPVAASLTFQSPHALRAQNMVIPFVLINAYGINYLVELFKGKRRLYVSSLFAFVLILSFIRYQHMYWIHMAKEYPYSSQYGLPELVNYVQQNQDKYSKIVITDRYDQPYILFLYYLKYPPQKFQGNHNLTARDAFGFSTVNQFDKYYFTTIRYDEARPDNPNSLIVGTPDDIPDEANIVKSIYGSNGYKYFEVVAN